ncbi:hypothetical protein SH139x_000135 [Planctomycetaceae bacterium SH139]
MFQNKIGREPAPAAPLFTLFERRRLRLLSLLGAGLLLCVYATHPAAAQSDRYELGKRLQRFETVWQTADEAARKRCLNPMQSAVTNFFSLKLRGAAAQLDEATFATVSATPATPTQRYAYSLQLLVSNQVASADETELRLRVAPFYETPEMATADFQLLLRLESVGDSQQLRHQVEWKSATVGCSLPFGSLPAGDYNLTASLIHGEQVIPFAQQMVARVDDWDARLERLRQASRSQTGGGNEAETNPAVAQFAGTARATFTDLLSKLTAQNDQQTFEVDYPTNRLLELCEALVAAPATANATLREHSIEHDTWLTLADGYQRVNIRCRAPQTANDNTPIPLLIAFHGAGGSENMFFETYGAGRLPQLAVERGWLVASPRQSLFGLGMDSQQIVTALAEIYPVDRQRIFFVGHSMGAGQVVQQVNRHPQLPTAAVALGGGGRPGRRAGESKIPWFIAAGEFDFGRSGAKSLSNQLRKTAAKVTYREYPQVEHMVIVQAALDDVFQFLDQQAEGR